LKRNRTAAKQVVPQKAHSRDGGAWRRLAKHVLPLSAVIGLVFLAYGNSFHTPFLLDNEEAILKDARVHAVTQVQIHRILTQQYWETASTGLYRPLTTLSFLFNYAVLGDGADPYGYHCFNFTLHVINIVLVYALGLALFDWVPAALLLSAFWGLHPVLTEAITNIVGRSDMLVAFSVLTALLCHRRALGAAGWRKVAWLGAVALVTAVGVFSKESAVVVVAVFAIYDLTYGRSAKWLARIPSYAAAAIPCLIYLYVRAQVLGNAPVLPTPFYENPLLGADFWTARMTAIKTIGEYFGLLVWPAKLSWDYGYNAVPLFDWRLGSWEDLKAVFSLLGCVACVVAALLSRRTRMPVFFAVAFFSVTLSPTSNLAILIGATMGERFLYLPSVGFAVGVVWALIALWRRLPDAQPTYRYVAGGLVGVALIGFAARTHERNGDWNDPQRFWLSGPVAAPGSYKTNMAAAANTFILSGADAQRSIGYAERALAILDGLPDAENSPSAYRDAGIFFRNLGDRVANRNGTGKPPGPDATAWYRKSVEALLRSERLELAFDARYREENLRHGKSAVTSLPSKLYLELGRAYMQLGDTPHAIAAFERGRALESAPELLEELGAAYRASGEPRKAAMALVEALAMDPSRGTLAGQLVELYGRIDPGGCSVTRQGGVPALNPDCPLVHGDICAASRNVIGNYRRRGQDFEAGSIRSVAEQDLGCAAELLE
jgi:hypothetical protein